MLKTKDSKTYEQKKWVINVIPYFYKSKKVHIYMYGNFIINKSILIRV